MNGSAGQARRKRRTEELENLKAGGRNDSSWCDDNVECLATRPAKHATCFARLPLAQRVEAGKRE